MSVAVQRPRRLLAWLHRWAGLLTAAFLTVTALSGSLLLFTEELNLRGHLPRVSDRPGRPNLAPVLAALETEFPDHRVASVRFPEDEGLTWMVYLRHRETDDRFLVHLDPATGARVGQGSGEAVPFRRLLDLHYHYMAGPAGMAVATATGTCLILLSLSGVWLNRRLFREMFRWRVDLSRRRAGSFLWLHQWAGAWALAMALIWGSTGLLLVTPILTKALKPSKAEAAGPSWSTVADLRPMRARADERMPGGRLQSLALHKSGEVRMTFSFAQNWPWDRFGEVHLAPDGAVKKALLPHQRGLEKRFDAAVHSIHFGLVSPPAKALILIGALLVASLPVTGFVAWWLRTARRRPTPAK